MPEKFSQATNSRLTRIFPRKALGWTWTAQPWTPIQQQGCLLCWRGILYRNQTCDANWRYRRIAKLKYRGVRTRARDYISGNDGVAHVYHALSTCTIIFAQCYYSRWPSRYSRIRKIFMEFKIKLRNKINKR